MNRRRFLQDAAQAGMGLGVSTSLVGREVSATPGPAAKQPQSKAAGAAKPSAPSPTNRPASRQVTLLGGDWLVATDPQNVGGEEKWWVEPRSDAKHTKVPWIIQDVFVGYRGVAWFWRDFACPPNPHRGGRYLLRFGNVDYLADVWINSVHVGRHEGAQEVFAFDVTDAVKPNSTNHIAVRVLDPGEKPIDGFTYDETPHGAAGEVGGILDTVELLVTPAVRVEDLFVHPDPHTGKILIKTAVVNAEKKAVDAGLFFTSAPAASGETVAVAELNRRLAPGANLVETVLTVERPRLWELHDPFLYRVTVRVSTSGSKSFDEDSTRCGFREFKFEDGHFRLNGRRVFLRCSHTGADTPVAVKVPEDPDLVRRDIVNSKAMGFNMIRFIAGLPLRLQLDLCDEIGLMIYEENYASWRLEDSPQMPERFDRSTAAMIRRDRNHPSIVMWGLLNETGDGRIFRHAVQTLPLVRSLDESRLVMLGSGRFDCLGNFLNGLEVWKSAIGPEPNVIHNPKPYGICAVPLWEPGQVTLHPGARGEYSVVRWTAPEAGEYSIAAKFEGSGTYSTTDVHILRAGQPVYESFINLLGRGNECTYSADVKVAAGEKIDFVVGWGGSFDYGGWPGCRWVDSTALMATIRSKSGRSYDVATDFSNSRNPHGVWSYGYLPKGSKPDVAAFSVYSQCEPENETCVGGLSNPGSHVWEDVLSDQHYYPRVPHRRLEIARLRTIGGDDHPLFFSEYGIGSSVDLVRLTRHFEQIGKASCQGANNCRESLTKFMADWEGWKLADTFATPEEYFRMAVSQMAVQRSLGINAIRSNPRIIGYNLTGTADPLTQYGEGLTTAFRELKPGTIDAMFDAFYPLRWCLFAEPVSVYRETPVRLDAVLANEDALPPGEYPARLCVIGPDSERVLDRTIAVKMAETKGKPEPPFALPVFSEEVMIDGLTGKYRFLAALENGGAAAGRAAEFYVADPVEMPAVENEVLQWGEDAELSQWLAGHGIRTRPFSALSSAREVILVPGQPPARGGTEAWGDLVRRITEGATAVFLSMAVFKKNDNPLGWLPLANKGEVSMVSEYTHPSVYPKDEWAKKHPIFDGLPCGGLMDRTFYREIIPDARFTRLDTPAEAVAGAFLLSAPGYLSELMVSVHKLGKGRFILNALRIRETLGKDPVAERLLRNMLRYAAL